MKGATIPVLLCSIMLLCGCGKDVGYIQILKERQQYEQVYYFDNNSTLEIIVGSDDEFTIMREGQVLNTLNPNNNTLGAFPIISRTGLEVTGNVIFFTYNVNYTTGYDIEEDVNGNDITGSRKTDVRIDLLYGGRIRISIGIYENSINNNINKIVASRVFVSQ